MAVFYIEVLWFFLSRKNEKIVNTMYLLLLVLIFPFKELLHGNEDFTGAAAALTFGDKAKLLELIGNISSLVESDLKMTLNDVGGSLTEVNNKLGSLADIIKIDIGRVDSDVISLLIGFFA